MNEHIETSEMKVKSTDEGLLNSIRELGQEFQKEGQVLARRTEARDLAHQFLALSYEERALFDDSHPDQSSVARGKQGEIIVSRPGGALEKVSVVPPGHWLITDLRGEKYAVDPKTFAKRYKRVEGEEEIYTAMGRIVAIENPYHRRIRLEKPGGKEDMLGDANCLIAMRVDPDTNQPEGDPYIIDRDSFKTGYRPVRGRLGE